MARIRTVKPEFWTSSQIVECSPITRLAFIGMWNFCDDRGIHVADFRRLKMEVFPGDEITAADVEYCVNELLVGGLLREYQVGDRTYWIVTGWHHQKIDKPTYRHPQPPVLGGFSSVGSGVIDEATSVDPQPISDSSVAEGNVMEGKVKDDDVVNKQSSNLIDSVLAAYHKAFGVRSPGGSSLIKSIQARIEDYPKASLPDWWTTYFEHAWQDPFLSGQKDPKFTANLQYLLKSEVFSGVIEAAQRAEANHG